MRRTLLFSAMVLTFACSHDAGQSQAQNDTSRSAAAAQPGAGAGSAASGGSTATAPAGNAAVTLVGCLQGPAVSGATGTTGSDAGDRARARETGKVPGAEQTLGGASDVRFTLTNATVESGGVGANGAGGSGGPLLGAGSSVELDSLPADAQANVNKQVRVTGRINASDVRAEPSTAGGSTSPRDDVRANSTTAASGNAASRHLTVESVQVIAERCAAR
jgi:hypothetical protein